MSEEDILVFKATSTDKKVEPKVENKSEDHEKIMKRKEKFGTVEGTSEELEKRRQRFGVTAEEIQKNLEVTELSKRNSKKERKKFEKGGKFKRNQKKKVEEKKESKPLVQIDEETKKRREEKFNISQ
eukprot:gene11840-5170_t